MTYEQEVRVTLLFGIILCVIGLCVLSSRIDDTKCKLKFLEYEVQQLEKRVNDIEQGHNRHHLSEDQEPHPIQSERSLLGDK